MQSVSYIFRYILATRRNGNGGENREKNASRKREIRVHLAKKWRTVADSEMHTLSGIMGKRRVETVPEVQEEFAEKDAQTYGRVSPLRRL